MSIKNRFILAVIGVFTLVIILLTWLGYDVFQKEVNDLNSQIYRIKLEKLIQMANRNDDLYFEGVLPSEEEAKELVLDQIRNIYRSSTNPYTYPVILDFSGKLVIHPLLPKGVDAATNYAYMRTAVENATREGEIYYTFKGKEKWLIHKPYEPWGWIFIYTLPMDVKNRAIMDYMENSLMVAFSILTLLLLVSYRYISYLLKPFEPIIRKARRIAEGTIDTGETWGHRTRYGKEFDELFDALETMTSVLQKKLKIIDRFSKGEKLDDLHFSNKQDALGNAIMQMVRIKNDIETELKLRVEEEVKRNTEKQRLLIQQSRQAAMGEMIGAIAHQWRQPLNVIALKIQDFKDAYEYGELDEAYIDESTTKSMEVINYMSQTIDDFRNFFKPNKEKTPFNIKETVDNTTKFVKTQFTHHNIMLSIDIDRDYEFIGYPNELKQVILNILNNAKDAIVDRQHEDSTFRGKIEISLYTNHNHIEIIIQDNGGGIEEKICEKVFDPYFTTKDQGKGTGIGLYMSKTIIHEHMNGEIIVENRDDGARFTIKLPIQEARGN